MKRQMDNLKVAFTILEDGAKIPVGCNKASGYLVFDIRITFDRKSRWVKDGHRNPEPNWSTFDLVVHRDRALIELTYAALNNLPMFSCGVQNSYLQVPYSEKHYVVCGLEFGLDNVVKYAIIVRPLYDTKSAGADHCWNFRSTMEEMGVSSCEADPNF